MRLGRAGRPGLQAASEGFRGPASKSIWMRQATPLPPVRAGTLIKSPGVPQSAPAWWRPARRGLPVLGELELAWRLLPNEFIAVTGTNGKTTTTEWIGHIHREAGLPVAVVGNVGTAASSLIGHVDPRDDRRLRGVLLPARGHRRLRARGRRAAEPGPRPPRPPRDLRRLRRGQAADLRQPGQRRRRRGARRISASRTSAAARGRVTFGAGPGADLSDRAGYLWWQEEPLLRSDEISLPGRPQPPTRWPQRRPAWPAAWTVTPSQPGCGRSPASPTGWS